MSKPIFKKDKVYQKFNLKEIFGVEFGDKPELKEAIAQAIIEKIKTRTEDGLAIGGKRELKSPYSNEYAKSLAFKAAGKSKRKVNMSLSGDMLGLLDMINDTKNTIEIGWDDDQAPKAYNHNTGDTVPKRPFFGLNETEIRELKKQFKSEVVEAAKALEDEGRDAFTERALALLDRVRQSEESEED